MKTRRKFIKETGLVSSVITLGSKLSPLILHASRSPNDHLTFAVAGLNGRGMALIQSVLEVPNVNITHLCDVDSRATDKAQILLQDLDQPKAKVEVDYRKLMEDNSIDVVVIATPDHWHAPMAMMAAAAGKHVYVEKPCCHNPREGELLVATKKKYNALIQMGNQQRSGLATREAIADIRSGIIGKVYMGKAWYANTRGSIGRGKEAKVPEWLNWELWQGPAPRVPYRDNIVHYNWHWFWHWGTGEINNNGTHEIDICRWALDVKYPVNVTSSGGRYHFEDDWEFYDTQVANFEFEDGKLITWEGKSCNGHPYFERGRGVTIHGTRGTILMDRNAYHVFDQDGESIKYVKEGSYSSTTDTVGAGGLDGLHMNNLANAIRRGESLNADIEEGYISNLLPHLGNIAQECGGSIQTDPANGHVLNNAKAAKYWSREYEKGWEPVV